MLKIATIDTEFNNDKKILSAGLILSENLNITNFKEFVFKENVDYRTYKIHGLNYKYLKRYGKSKKEYLPILKEELLKQNIIIGFSMKQDLKVLNLVNLNYSFKLIDIDLIFKLFHFNSFSLEHCAKSLNILEKHKSKYPIHTSIMDSFLTFCLFKHLVDYINKITKIPIETIINDLSNIYSFKELKQINKLNEIKEKYICLSNIVNIIQKTKKEKIENKTFFSLFLKNSVEIYNQDMFMIAKYKHSLFKELFKNNHTKIFLKKEKSYFGFKDFNDKIK